MEGRGLRPRMAAANRHGRGDAGQGGRDVARARHPARRKRPAVSGPRKTEARRLDLKPLASPANLPSREGQTFAGESLFVRYANLVKLPHTLFALPFALVGTIYASRSVPITIR